MEINRLPENGIGDVHMKFEIPKKTEIMLQKPCHQHMDRWMEEVNRVSQSRVRRVLSTGANFTKITAVSHFIKNSNLKNKKICISDASRNISVI